MRNWYGRLIVLCVLVWGALPAFSSEPGGLRLRNSKGVWQGECPLEHTDVHAEISGFVARVDVTQRFRGAATAEPVEAVYTFPLPEDAAVDTMELRVGRERVIRGVLKRREEARKTYEAAKSAGKVAALLDQERTNIFTQSVANLMPGETVEVRLSYVVTLKYQDGAGEFVFPMVVAPRFSSGSENKPSSAAMPASRPAHDIALTVRLDAGLPLLEVSSPLHPLRVQALSPTRAQVTLAPGPGASLPNKDFILRYRVAGAELQEGLLTHADGKSGEFLLVLQPPAAPARETVTPKEVIFVVDQTGSQSGEPLEKSKATMRFCLQNLNPDDTFQVIGFNTTVMPCFDRPQRATPQNRIVAQRFIDSLNAEGGTDILGSVEHALRQPDDPQGRVRIISYMTDGLVDNESVILATIARERGRVRLFPFGIGDSVNRALLEGMAREGRGACQIVDLAANSQKVAADFARRIADPLLTDISVDWGGLAVEREEVYPRHIPDVFAAEPILLKGRYTKGGSGTITIRGKLRGKPWLRTLTLTLPNKTTGGSAIGTLWARAKLEDLRQQYYRSELDGHPKDALKETMTRLALAHNLMSEFTSFVAVEERIANASQRSKTQAVPVHQPEGMEEVGATASVPEPAVAGLFVLGAAGIWLRHRRRK